MGVKTKPAGELEPGDELILPDGRVEIIGMVFVNWMTVVASWVRHENLLSMRMKEEKARFHVLDKVRIRVPN